MNVRQQDFGAALLDPARPAPAGLNDGAGNPSGRRFDIYRNNVTTSLIRAMHTGFPVVSRLLGQQNMDGLAAMFLRKHPPVTPVVLDYGTDFPAFLASCEQLAHLAYLPDVARLELAIRRAYHAADAKPVAADILAGTDPETLMHSAIALAPAVQVLRSKWPVYDIWLANSETGAPAPAPGPQDILIARPGFDPVPKPLPPGGAVWIDGLQAGLSIGAALDLAQADTPDFDLAETFALLLGGEAVIELTPKG